MMLQLGASILVYVKGSRIGFLKQLSLSFLLLALSFAISEGKASAYVFKVTNTEKEPIEVSVAYETDRKGEQADTFGKRTIDGFFLVQPGATVNLFLYSHLLKTAWVGVRSGADKVVWQPSDRPTFDVSPATVTCKVLCRVEEFPGFKGEVLLSPFVRLAVIDSGMTLHMVKIAENMLDQDTEFKWTRHVDKKAINVCNKSGRPVHTSFAYFDTHRQEWVSSGWYQIKADACAQPVSGDQGDVYAFATDDLSGNGRTTWIPTAGAASFCTDPTTAYILTYDACVAGGDTKLRVETFGRLDVADDGSINWNIEP
jgi:uncharacterized membrane protein